MMPPLSNQEQRRVCDGCGQANFLRYTIRLGDRATAVDRVYCSLACAQLHFPGYTGGASGR